MRKTINALGLALALAAAALSGGCAYLSRVTHQEQIATYDEKALLTLEIAFDGAMSTIEAANASGVLTQERAQVILPLVQEARTALVHARALYDFNHEAEAAASTRSALVAVANLIQAMIDAGILREAPA